MRFLRNWTYLFWVLLYAAILERILFRTALVHSYVGIIWEFPRTHSVLIVGGAMVFSAIIGYYLFEPIWRIINGVRPLRLNKEIERLMPLFKEVYQKAYRKDKTLYDGIKLYIHEDMEINAFAFGQETLALTKGATMLLSDEDIKGLIAHEIGHFSNGDPSLVFFSVIFIMPLSLIKTFFERTRPKIIEASKKSFIILVFKGFFDIFYYLFKAIMGINELITMHNRRQSEYRADKQALKYGYGKELASALITLYESSITGKVSIMDMMRATHPHITKRIEQLEIALGRKQYCLNIRLHQILTAKTRNLEKFGL